MIVDYKFEWTKTISNYTTFKFKIWSNCKVVNPNGPQLIDVSSITSKWSKNCDISAQDPKEEIIDWCNTIVRWRNLGYSKIWSMKQDSGRSENLRIFEIIPIFSHTDKNVEENGNKTVDFTSVTSVFTMAITPTPCRSRHLKITLSMHLRRQWSSVWWLPNMHGRHLWAAKGLYIKHYQGY